MPTKIPTDPQHVGIISTLRAMRFLGSFAFGIVATVRILQLEAAGISPARIGTLMAAYSVLVGVVEIPSGAVADVWGRRRTKLASSVVLVSSFGVFAFVESYLLAVIALALLGIGRALASGPMESWFVDEIGDPHHPSVLAGIASAEVARNVGVALGAVLGGLIPWLLAGSVSEGRVFGPVFLIAAGALGLDAMIAVRRMVETVPASAREIGGVWKTTLSGVRGTLDQTVPRWVAAVFVTYGAFNASVELITPQSISTRFGTDRAALWFGVLVAFAWLVSAYTATRTTHVERWAGSAARAAGIGTLVAVAFALPAALSAWVGASFSYIGLNALGGPLLPLLATIVHRHVLSAHRSTAMSTLNLSFMVGATVGSVLVAALDRSAFLVVAGAALFSGAGLLRSQQRAGLNTQDSLDAT